MLPLVLLTMFFAYCSDDGCPYLNGYAAVDANYMKPNGCEHSAGLSVVAVVVVGVASS